MLFPIPKLSLRLHYSRCEYVTARADFVILDLLSDCRMAVFEDKYTDSGRSDSTPQLIAEAIAAHQHNFRKAHGMSDICFMLNERAKKYTFCDPFFGVRVFGSKFQFFVIPVSAAIMKAMETRMRAEGPTTIFKLASKSELDFKIPSDRALIIKLLGQMPQNIEIKGAKSSQRNAMMLKTAK